MKIRVYVRQNGDGYTQGACEANDVEFVQDTYEEMTTKGKDQASEFMYIVERAALDYVHNNPSIVLPTTVLVELSATALVAEV
jgi:phosphoribulokinase